MISAGKYMTTKAEYECRWLMELRKNKQPRIISYSTLEFNCFILVKRNFAKCAKLLPLKRSIECVLSLHCVFPVVFGLIFVFSSTKRFIVSKNGFANPFEVVIMSYCIFAHMDECTPSNEFSAKYFNWHRNSKTKLHSKPQPQITCSLNKKRNSVSLQRN